MSNQISHSLSVDLADITVRLFSNCHEMAIRQAAKYGVSIGEFRCLRILFQKKALTVNQMAQEMSITSSYVTRIVDGLVAKKLVQRVKDRNDGRVHKLSVTPKGEKLANELTHEHIKIHEQIIKQIPEEAHQLTIEILGQLNRALATRLAENPE